MGIYVKNMQLPEDYLRCPFWDSSTYHCLASEKWCDGFDGDCPLVEVKQHGRLIDESVVKINLVGLEEVSPTGMARFDYIQELVDATPTVIEAEG